jgi:hypothetical protein
MGASSVRRWVKHFKDGNTDIAGQQRCGRPRTAASERKKQKVDELIRRSDARQTSSWRFVKNVRRRKLIIQHGNARPHIALPILQTIQKDGWELLSHPPYSPDLIPTDYHLFGPFERSPERSPLRD